MTRDEYDELQQRLAAGDWARFGTVRVSRERGRSQVVWHLDPRCRSWADTTVEERPTGGPGSIDQVLAKTVCASSWCARATGRVVAVRNDAHRTYQTFDVIWKLRALTAGDGADEADLVALWERSTGHLAMRARESRPVDRWLGTDLAEARDAARPVLVAAATQQALRWAVNRSTHETGLDADGRDAERATWELLAAVTVPVRGGVPSTRLTACLWPATGEIHQVPYPIAATATSTLSFDPSGAAPWVQVLCSLLAGTPVRDAAHATELLEAAHAV